MRGVVILLELEEQQVWNLTIPDRAMERLIISTWDGRGEVTCFENDKQDAQHCVAWNL